MEEKRKREREGKEKEGKRGGAVMRERECLGTMST